MLKMLKDNESIPRCFLVFIVLLSWETKAVVRKIPPVECDAHGTARSVVVTCRFPAEVSAEDLQFDILAVDKKTSMKDFIHCFTSETRLKCMINGEYTLCDQINNTAIITIQDDCEKFDQYTCKTKSDFDSKPCNLVQTENCSSEGTVTKQTEAFNRPETDTADKGADKGDNETHITVLIVVPFVILIILLIGIITMRLMIRRHCQAAAPVCSFEASSLLWRNDFEKKEESFVAPFTQWTEEKRRFLMNCQESLTGASESQLDKLLLACKKLECECKIYMDDQRRFTNGLAETKGVIPLLRELRSEVSSVISQLESQQQVFVFNLLKFSTYRMKQNIYQTIEYFLTETQKKLDQMFFDEDKDRSLDKLQTCLTTVMKMDVTCNFCKELLNKKMNSQLGTLRPHKNYDAQHWKLAMLHDKVMQFQVIFTFQFAKKLDQQVLCSITDRMESDKTNETTIRFDVSKEDPTVTQHQTESTKQSKTERLKPPVRPESDNKQSFADERLVNKTSNARQEDVNDRHKDAISLRSIEDFNILPRSIRSHSEPLHLLDFDCLCVDEGGRTVAECYTTKRRFNREEEGSLMGNQSAESFEDAQEYI